MARTYKKNESSFSDERVKCERIYGREACSQVYHIRPDAIVKTYVRKGEEGRYKEILSDLAKDRIGYNLVPEEELRKISQTEHHEGICMLVKKREKVSLASWSKSLKDCRGVLFLDGVDNPHNIGGILRTALYFGLTHIVLNSKTKYNLSGSLARISEGAVEYLHILQDFNLEELSNKLKEEDFKIIISTTEVTAKLPELKDVPSKWVIVVGSEGSGISKEVSSFGDLAIHIEAGSKLQSLNVSVATGIMLYELTKVA